MLILQWVLPLRKYSHKVDLISYVIPRLKMIRSLYVWELHLQSNYCSQSFWNVHFPGHSAFWSTLHLGFFLPLFLGEFYWKPYLPIWPLLSPWYCISSSLPPRHSFCVPGTKERKWMSALPSGSVLWQACNSSALRRSPLSCRVNTFSFFCAFSKRGFNFFFHYFIVLSELKGISQNICFAFRHFF